MPTTKPVVHKETSSAWTLCGAHWLDEVKSSTRWKKVTCKPCLKKGGRL